MAGQVQINDPILGKVVDKYRFVKKLGGGAFGAVYQAEHIRLGKSFAVKVLHPHIASEVGIIERFKREAESLSKLNHPNIVQVSDFDSADGIGFYLVLEWLDGDALSDILKKRVRLPIHEVVDLFEQLLSGLQEAHNQGIVHRDLKPANVMVIPTGAKPVLKILDFGIAAMKDSDQGLTMTGTAMGSANYMSPEQALGEIRKIDPRSDLYSCGIILGKCLVGRNIFVGESPTQILFKHVQDQPPTLASIYPEGQFTPEIEAVFAKSIAKKQEDRFQSATEFLDAVRHAAASLMPNQTGNFPGFSSSQAGQQLFARREASSSHLRGPGEASSPNMRPQGGPVRTFGQKDLPSGQRSGVGTRQPTPYPAGGQPRRNRPYVQDGGTGNRPGIRARQHDPGAASGSRSGVALKQGDPNSASSSRSGINIPRSDLGSSSGTGLERLKQARQGQGAPGPRRGTARGTDGRGRPRLRGAGNSGQATGIARSPLRSDSQPAVQPDQNKQKLILFGVIGFLVVCVGILGIFILKKKDVDKKPDERKSEQREPVRAKPAKRADNNKNPIDFFDPSKDRRTPPRRRPDETGKTQPDVRKPVDRKNNGSKSIDPGFKPKRPVVVRRRPKYVKLTVTSSPGKAKVWFNKRFKGLTPLTFRVRKGSSGNVVVCKDDFIAKKFYWNGKFSTKKPFSLEENIFPGDKRCKNP